MIRTEEDDEFARIEHENAMKKGQPYLLLVDAGCAERGCIGYDPRDGDAVLMATRNDTLEEVAKEFDKMPFGDTVASFAIFVRNMKT